MCVFRSEEVVRSTETSTAFLTATEALDGLDLRLEVVVECQLFVCFDMASCNKDDMSLSVDVEVFRNQVRLARVVDIAGLASKEGSIDDVVFVESEVVAIADSKLLIAEFSFIGHRVPNLFANVLDHDVTVGQGLACEEAIAMDFADPYLNEFGTLFGGSVLHRGVDVVSFVTKLVEIGQSTTFAPSLALVMMLTSKVQPCCRVLVRILFLFVTLSLSGYLGARVGPISSTSVEHWELTSAIHLL